MTSLPSMYPLSWWLVGASLAAIALVLRIAIHAGRFPGGVDTWYYLAYADAVRRQPGLTVRLPQYLLQDERQSYPPLFPTLLGLLPQGWLARWFWIVSPAVDCLHLFFLYFVAYKITGSISIAALAACAYAFTPQLVSESRSLNGRTFGSLLHSMALLLALKSSSGGWPWLAAALLGGTALYLSSAALSAAYGLVCAVLSLAFTDPRYLLIASGSCLLAFVASGGHYARVVRNYFQAVDYWRRNRRHFGAHPVRDSPIYGKPGGEAPRPPRRAGLLDRNVPQQLVRLLGENPFLLALPLAPYGVVPWGPRLYTWAMSLAFLSLLATLLPPLRAFGPGRSYMKAAVFPTAYTLAFGIGSVHGLGRPVGIASLACLVLSVGAIAFFYWSLRNRDTEHTASTPAGLLAAAQHLAGLPAGGVFCLPYMYADYTAYHSGKPLLWGGHCGSLRKLEDIAPLIVRPLPELFREHGVRYVLLDRVFAHAEELRLEGTSLRGRWDTFELYEVGTG